MSYLSIRFLELSAYVYMYMYVYNVHVLLACATSGFSGSIKLAYCSAAKGAPVVQLVRASD